ncbi:MFS transporter [Halalkalibacter akibai]|uniref:Major facilitator superfamily (MFS) profile domain-containing protein n=1 Tax=Halalkalibacter akibai (strain ATCC 43226 / DSM 21942 / CIP 109018 / JCM 9157 / 1139) TaxID=1236973 RepID=W4QVZ2_HALA3|nr:MFS transporter [Halalkalibacter akibai]GAE35474.1 hypothetical protein JCM9157_2583 [Halalkalibacter akibai JCM 9157]
MNRLNIRLLVFSQSTVFFASSLIFPFYILFIKNIGVSFTQFGFAYGLFGLSSALVHPLISRLSPKIGNQLLLSIHSFGMAFVLLAFPHIQFVGQVYIIQVLLGILGALQKHGEKTLLAEFTTKETRDSKIGIYHFWTGVFSAGAIMISGFLADFFTIHLIFYISSLFYLISGLLIQKMKRTITPLLPEGE